METTSQIVSLADALVTELNALAQAGTFVRAFTAVRAYRPVYSLEELRDLHVTVVPRSLDLTGSTRAANQHDIGLDIGIHLKVDDADNADVDELMLLVEQIAGALRFRRLPLAMGAAWVRSSNNPIYSPVDLEQRHLFVSVIQLTYRMVN